MPITWYGWKRTLNKILAYTVIAILLGTVTMVAPLALLGPSEPIPDTEYPLTVPEAAEPNNQERADTDGGLLESGNFSAQVTSPEPAPAEPAAPAEVAPEEPSPQEPVLAVKTTENPSDLSPIGFMTVPSFLVALGVFVYLRKRMS